MQNLKDKTDKNPLTLFTRSQFLSRNYRLIVAPRKFDVLKTEKRSFEGKYASFKNIKFPRGNYQTDSSET